MTVSFFQTFYDALFAKEKRNAWCYGGKAGIGFAAKNFFGVQFLDIICKTFPKNYKRRKQD